MVNKILKKAHWIVAAILVITAMSSNSAKAAELGASDLFYTVGESLSDYDKVMMIWQAGTDDMVFGGHTATENIALSGMGYTIPAAPVMAPAATN